MMNSRRHVTVSCFEISQSPEFQTDYEFIRAPLWASPALKQMMQLDIHKALAEPLVASEVLIIGWGFFPPVNGAQIYLCRCQPIKINNRPILYLQGIAVPLTELMQAQMTPLDLYFSDIWQQFERSNASTLTASSGATNQNRAPLAFDSLLRGEIAKALEDTGSCQRVDEGLGFTHAVELVRQSLDFLNPTQRYQLNLAIGIPKNLILATKPSLIIFTEEPAPGSQNVVVASAQSEHDVEMDPVNFDDFDQVADHYKHFLMQLADEAARSNLGIGWPMRIWNRCQNIITEVEIVQQSGKENDSRRRILRSADELMTELARSGAINVIHSADAVAQQTERFIHFSPPIPLWRKALTSFLALALVLLLLLLWLGSTWLNPTISGVSPRQLKQPTEANIKQEKSQLSRKPDKN